MPAGLLSSVDDLVARLATFEARLHSPDDCVAIVARLARLEKACAAARSVAAARVEAGGAHRAQGFVHASDWLAHMTGATTTEAERELSTAAQLDQLPTAQEAVRTGELSMAQAHEVAATVAVCPDAERELVAAAGASSLRALRDEGRKRRLAAIDPDDLHHRQRAARYHRHWRDEMGMVRYSGAMLPEQGIPFITRLEAETDRERRAARRAGLAETREQHAADAFARMVAGEGKGHAVRADVVFVCDVTTGAAHIVGGGPVPMSTVREATRDAFIKAVVHDGVQVDSVVHYGRKKIPAVLRTVLDLGDAPDFNGVDCIDCGRKFGIEWDHADPVANNGPTTRRNLKPRCWDCHHEKTERDRLAGLLDRTVEGRQRGQPP